MSDETKIPENEETPEAEKKEKKKSKKDIEIEKLKSELDLKSDQLMRTAAEFDNFKKRTEREKASVAEFAKAGLIKQLLPIIDNIIVFVPDFSDQLLQHVLHRYNAHDSTIFVCNNSHMCLILSELIHNLMKTHGLRNVYRF